MTCRFKGLRSRLWCSILAALPIVLVATLAIAAAPTRFISRGPGGGGAFFDPSINPFNPDDLWVGSDMSDLFHSTDFGRNWDTIDFRMLQGGSLPGRMQFTSNPLVRYSLNSDVPYRTADGGLTWSMATPAASPSVYSLFADPYSTNRILASDYSDLYISTNSGLSYSNIYSASDLLIAGAFWDGSSIYVGTRPGLLVSTNGGKTFTQMGQAGIPATESMVSFAGARENGTLRFFCVTLGSADVYPGIQGSDYANYHAIYKLDGGAGTWSLVTNGISGNYPFFVAMSRTNVSVAYVAGSDSLGQPCVFKTVNGGSSWSQVMQCSANANVATGWTGDDSGSWNWKKWSFGECAMGFTVCPSDLNRAVITDFGFIHATTNGGVTWQQAYDWPGCQNAVGAYTPKTNFFTGSGAEDTSCWSLSWFSSNTLFCSFTDIRGMLSINGGASWMSPLSLTANSTYQALKHPTNGLVYAAISSVHDMYAWDKYCGDAAIDGGTGSILYSTNSGFTWNSFKNLGKPVVALALDPNNPIRMYASVVNSTNGGIYRTTNLNAGTSSTWTRLALPPRTQGHAYNIYVLNDGTLVTSYSARIASNNFQPSSGVFVSTTDGASWVDRTDPAMQYYTKDVAIDPNDPAQNTWYAGVWGEWGNSSGFGGLYATTNRGVNWKLILNLKAIGSCTISTNNPNEMYVTTEDQGLWYSSNRKAASPTFTQVAGYPFKFPSRVFYNPYDTNEVWVTSYGNGMRLGRITEPAPTFLSLQRTNATSTLTIGAALGQKIVLSASSNLQSWVPIATNMMYTNRMVLGEISSASLRFFRASVQ